MVDLAEQLRRYGDAIGESLAGGTGLDGADGRGFRPTRSTPRRPRRRALVVAATLVVAGTVTATAVVAVQSGRRDAPDLAASGAPAGAVFDARTDTVLVFSDGIDGITALDLDAGLVARRVVEGERAGDQPFRVSLVDEHLVVGWGEIYAAPLDGGRSARIDSAQIYIPAAEPGEVWTVNPGPLGQGQGQIRRVTTDGTAVVSTDALDLDRYSPLYGVPGGLVVQGPQGLAIWDAESGRVADPIGASARPVSVASDGTHLAWCDESCRRPQLVTLERTGRSTAPAAAIGQRVALSPDGRRMATLRSVSDRAELAVTDLISGQDTPVANLPAVGGSIQWSDDGRQLFYARASLASGDTTLGRYDPRSGAWQLVDLDLDVGHAAAMFVPVERDRGAALVAGERVEPAQCPEVGDTFPSGRTDPCAFTVRTSPPADG